MKKIKSYNLFENKIDKNNFKIFIMNYISTTLEEPVENITIRNIDYIFVDLEFIIEKDTFDYLTSLLERLNILKQYTDYDMRFIFFEYNDIERITLSFIPNDNIMNEFKKKEKQDKFNL